MGPGDDASEEPDELVARGTGVVSHAAGSRLRGERISGCGRRSLPVAVQIASADDVGGVEGLDRGVVEASFTQDLVGVFTEGGR